MWDRALLKRHTPVVAKDSQLVVDGDPGEDAFLLAAKNASVEAGSVKERLEGRLTHHRVDVTDQRVHPILHQ